MDRQFFHHLHDTIILLGGGTRIAKMLERWETLTEADTDELRAFNCKLVTLTKDKLAHTHKMTVWIIDEESADGP